MANEFRKHHFNLILAVAVTSVAMIASSLTASAPTYATDFSDIDNHWAKSYVEVVSTHKAVSGYVDGTFKPDDPIQRVEFIAIVVNAQGLEVRTPAIGEYWGQPYIEAAVNSGLILSNEYGNTDEMTLSMNITREEMASIVVNAYVISGGLTEPLVLNDASTKLSDFDSVAPRYYENAIASVALDFITGYSNGTFAPKQNASRAQAAVLSYKLLIKLGIITDLDLPENIILSKSAVKQGDLLKLTVYHADTPSEIALVQDLYPNFKWYDKIGRAHV